MSLSQSHKLRRRLVAELRKRELITSPRVEAAFCAVAREAFVPHAAHELGLEAVYRDEVIVTKTSDAGLPLSSSSQPAIMALMLELLDVEPGDRVLEVGAGTGYNAALLSHLVGPKGSVVSVDIDPSLVRQAKKAVRDAGAKVTVVAGDGRSGYPSGGPFDRIIATAAADEIPRAWLDQLRQGGRLVTPLRLDSDGASIQLIPAFERRGDSLEASGMTWGGFMPLHGGDGGHQRPAGNLSASRSVGDDHAPLISLTGAGVARLSNSATRQVLGMLLSGSEPACDRGMTPAGGGQPPLILTDLLLRIPTKRRVWLRQGDRWGIGLASRDGLAIVSIAMSPQLRASRVGRVSWRLDAYGKGRSVDELALMLNERRQLSRERRNSLHTVAKPRGKDEQLKLTFAWD